MTWISVNTETVLPLATEYGDSKVRGKHTSAEVISDQESHFITDVLSWLYA